MNRIFLRENTLYEMIANSGKDVLDNLTFLDYNSVVESKYRESCGGDG